MSGVEMCEAGDSPRGIGNDASDPNCLACRYKKFI